MGVGLGFEGLGLRVGVLGLGFGGVVGGLVGFTKEFEGAPWFYVHTFVRNLLIEFLMMLFLVAIWCDLPAFVDGAPLQMWQLAIMIL